MASPAEAKENWKSTIDLNKLRWTYDVTKEWPDLKGKFSSGFVDVLTRLPNCFEHGRVALESFDVKRYATLDSASLGTWRLKLVDWGYCDLQPGGNGVDLLWRVKVFIWNSISLRP